MSGSDTPEVSIFGHDGPENTKLSYVLVSKPADGGKCEE